MTPEVLRTLPSAKALSLPLQALWHDAQGDWDQAHAVCQAAGDRDGDWVHAYLHRKEGDLANAGYWYARARRSQPPASLSLEDEWTLLAGELLRAHASPVGKSKSDSP